MTAPILEIERARIDAGGVTLASSISLVAEGPRVVVVGDGAAVLAPLLGKGTVVEGTFRIGGETLERARPLLGLCPFDVVLPLDDTPLAYVTWSARLANMSAADAASAARIACGKSGLGDLASQPLRKLPPLHRRLALLAHAAVAPTLLLVVESPFVGLDAASSGFLLGAIGRLAGNRAVIVSTPRFEPGSPAESLARGASQVLVLAGGKLLEAGAPSTIRTLWPAKEGEEPAIAPDIEESPPEPEAPPEG